MIVEFAWNGMPVRGISHLVAGSSPEPVGFRYVVDILSLRDCLLSVASLASNPYFHGVRYVGDLSSLLVFLQEFGTVSVPLMMRYMLPAGSTLESLSSVLGSVPSQVRVCVVTSADFHDLKLVHDISTQFPNVGFCGGSFLQLDGCRYGCLSGYPFKQNDFHVRGCPYMNSMTDECFWVVSDTDTDFCVDYYSGFDPGVEQSDVPWGGPDSESMKSKKMVGSISDLF